MIIFKIKFILLLINTN